MTSLEGKSLMAKFEPRFCCELCKVQHIGSDDNPIAYCCHCARPLCPMYDWSCISCGRPYCDNLPGLPPELVRKTTLRRHHLHRLR